MTNATTFGLLMSASLRSLERPVAAKYAPMVAFRPEVEKFGFVLPSRKAPHSGWPTFPHPAGSWANDRMSDHPSGLVGHPSAPAIGRGMAITSGVSATWGSVSGTRSGASRSARRWRRRTVQDDDAGDQTSGRGPSIRSSHPRASASAAPPEAFDVTWTTTHRGPMVGPVLE